MALTQGVQSQTAEEIISKHISAIGGYEKIKSIKSLIFEAVIKFPDHIRHLKSYIIHDSAIHTDIVNSDGKNGYGIVTKTEGWTFDATKNSMEKKSKGEIRQVQYSFDLHGPLIDYRQKGHKIKFSGRDTINGLEYLTLRVIKSNKDRLTYFFDSSYFVFRVEYFLSGINLRYFVDYTYQSIEGGYFFVHKAKHYGAGVEVVYTNYIINPEIDRSLFLPHNVNRKDRYH